LADALRRAVDSTDEPPSVSPDAAEPDTAETGKAERKDSASYRIGEVAGLVGVDAHVLRYWESEFRLKPERSASGQRVYRQKDLARFLRIKSLLHDEGYTIAGARRVMENGVESQPTVDNSRLQAALERVRGVREQISEMRDQIEMELIHR
jgi:DNA-binding transcriptional MerR regulator